MHDTALALAAAFFEVHCPSPDLIVELGSYDVNGSVRSVAPPSARYVGLDTAAGPGVDLVLAPGAPLPIDTDAADVVLSSSVLEHDPMFWLTFLEMVRVVRPGGLIYMNAPSNGPFHRYPIDCWRFYPDAGHALVQWAQANGHRLTLVESFVADRLRDVWNDFVAVFRKEAGEAPAASATISDRFGARNVHREGTADLEGQVSETEDMELLRGGAGAAPAATRHDVNPAAAADESVTAGDIDAVSAGYVIGWAIDRRSPDRLLSIDVYVDDNFVGSAAARDYRGDLRLAGQGPGLHGFRVRLPLAIGDGQAHDIMVQEGRTGERIVRKTVVVEHFE